MKPLHHCLCLSTTPRISWTHRKLEALPFCRFPPPKEGKKRRGKVGKMAKLVFIASSLRLFGSPGFGKTNLSRLAMSILNLPRPSHSNHLHFGLKLVEFRNMHSGFACFFYIFRQTEFDRHFQFVLRLRPPNPMCFPRSLGGSHQKPGILKVFDTLLSQHHIVVAWFFGYLYNLRVLNLLWVKNMAKLLWTSLFEATFSITLPCCMAFAFPAWHSK